MGFSPVIRQRFFDANGKPLSGGKLYTFKAGTTTPQVTYSDPDCTVPNLNPVILDSEGYADVWFNSGAYKFVLKNANDEILWTKDDIKASASGVSDGSESPWSPWTTYEIEDNQGATPLEGETVDFDKFSSAIYEAEIIRGTTVIANGRFCIENLNGTAQIRLGVFSANPQVTFSVTQNGSVATLNVATSTGPGNGTVKLSRRLIPV